MGNYNSQTTVKIEEFQNYEIDYSKDTNNLLLS